MIVSGCDVDVYCEPPPELRHGYYICHPHNCNLFKAGTVVQYGCERGYSMKPEQLLYPVTCREDGTWQSLSSVRRLYCVEGMFHFNVNPRVLWFLEFLRFECHT